MICGSCALILVVSSRSVTYKKDAPSRRQAVIILPVRQEGSISSSLIWYQHGNRCPFSRGAFDF